MINPAFTTNYRQALYAKMVNTSLSLYDEEGPSDKWLEIDTALDRYDIATLERLDKELNLKPS